MRCPYWDCGWCYAPVNVEKNDLQGECQKPMECPYLKWLSDRKNQLDTTPTLGYGGRREHKEAT